VGTVTADPIMRITHHGEMVAEIPNKSLTDDAPLYHRPVGTWNAPVPADPPAHITEALRQPRDYTADLKKLLTSENLCSKRWVYEQYDSMVQTNTVQGPGCEAGVMRIKGTNTGLAMALAGNGRWAYLDPKLGAMHAVAEAARKVACTGAKPVAATNCLNFGNPEKPEIMAQLSAAIDGIAEACTALGTPVTGGNVSLYNETRGEGIYPTPVLGIVGLIDDVTKAVPSSFQRAGDKILLLESVTELPASPLSELGSSEYAKNVLGGFWGSVPRLNLEAEAALQQALQLLSKQGLIHSACDIASGGLAVAMAKSCFEQGVGARVYQGSLARADYPNALFAENASEALVTCSPEDYGRICMLLDEAGDVVYPLDIGETIDDALQIIAGDDTLIDASVSELKAAFTNALEKQLAGEVTA